MSSANSTADDTYQHKVKHADDLENQQDRGKYPPSPLVTATATATGAKTDDGDDDDDNNNNKKNGFWSTLLSKLQVRDGEVYEASSAESNPRWYQRLLDAGIEENGIKPVPLEHRTSTRYNYLFTVFFTCLLCLLP